MIANVGKCVQDCHGSSGGQALAAAGTKGRCMPADGDELLDLVHLLACGHHHQWNGPKHLVEGLKSVGELAVCEELVCFLQRLTHTV